MQTCVRLSKIYYVTALLEHYGSSMGRTGLSLFRLLSSASLSIKFRCGRKGNLASTPCDGTANKRVSGYHQLVISSVSRSAVEHDGVGGLEPWDHDFILIPMPYYINIYFNIYAEFTNFCWRCHLCRNDALV